MAYYSFLLIFLNTIFIVSTNSCKQPECKPRMPDTVFTIAYQLENTNFSDTVSVFYSENIQSCRGWLNDTKYNMLIRNINSKIDMKLYPQWISFYLNGYLTDDRVVVEENIYAISLYLYFPETLELELRLFQKDTINKSFLKLRS